MIFFIYSISLIFIFCIDRITNSVVTAKVHTQDLQKRFMGLIHFLRLAPLVVMLIMTVLVLTTFHSIAGIRLSHAWYTAQFWSYSTFFYICYQMFKKKSILLLIAASLSVAIYLTPIDHYQHFFRGNGIIFANGIALLMYIALWAVIGKIMTNKKLQ